MAGIQSLKDILQVAVKIGASDVHIKTFAMPTFRVSGQLVRVEQFGLLKPEDIDAILVEVLNQEQRDHFREHHEIDLAYSVAGVGRFRVNVFQQRGSVGIVFRTIPFHVKSIEELHLPEVLKQISLIHRGLILVTGTTGSGKSTTLAAMVDYINNHRTSHILTIEDPIEFLIRDKRALINQREVGIDTTSFSKALRSALRQDPDIIMVGEMRDLETIEIALTAAETGHLVVSTLHTLDAAETVNRIISVFPPHQQEHIRIQLSSVLKAVISQRLLKRSDNKGRIPAVEVLINTPLVQEIIRDPHRFKEMRDVIEKGHSSYGMQTFDQSIFQLLTQGFISEKEALDNASKPDDLLLRMKGVAISGDGDWRSFDKDGGQFDFAGEKYKGRDDEFEIH